MNIYDDFPMLKKGYIYFDNGATTFKPQCVIDSIKEYYENYSVNAHRGDYTLSLKVDTVYEGVREKVRNFINAKNSNDIIFTSGTTESLNVIMFGYVKNILNSGDEILITKAEHASLTLPCFEISKLKNAKVNYIPLDKNDLVTVENVKRSITPKTKVIALAHVTNIMGDERPLKEIIELAHQNNIIVVVDGAQSVPHVKIDVQELDIDFLAFSAHKMYGPTGVGVLYGKDEYLEKVTPHNYGGGMNNDFSSDVSMELKRLPQRLEAGTPNIAGVIGFGSAIDYISKFGMDQIRDVEINLKKYALSKLKKLDNIEIYNDNSVGSTIAFNVKGIFSQDVAIYLSKRNICIRAGNHCSKMLKEHTGVKNTCRVSFSFYNSEEEIDELVKALDNKNILEESIM